MATRKNPKMAGLSFDELLEWLRSDAPPKGESSKSPVRGIDVSHYQGPVNWGIVAKSGVRFASIKATEGASNYPFASYYRQNIGPARKAGLIAGGYHFHSANMDGKLQAEYFLKVAQPQTGDLLPMLDIEQTNGVGRNQIIETALLWLDTVGKSVGKRPFVYTTASFWSRIGNPGGFGDYPLWVADYRAGPPKLPFGWNAYVVWQKSQRGRIPGVPNPVDLDQFNATAGFLRDYRV